MQAAALAKAKNCDMFIGLGGGSSIDTAKACAIVHENGGTLWEYATVGSGKNKPYVKAAPVIAISTTAGTGSECDQYCVITNEKTGEKIDFASDAIFPRLSLIDPALTLSLPKTLTVYQGFDALFHAVECYIANQNENYLVDLYAVDAISRIVKWLPVAAKDGQSIEARVHMSFAANILCGYTMAMVNVTSHHIIGQCLGGMFGNLVHGASLIVVAKAYYTKIKAFVPEALERLGVLMGEKPTGDKGQCFINALERLRQECGLESIQMSEYGIKISDLPKAADMIVDTVGIGFDIYSLSKRDIVQILTDSYQ